jgi:hypothetical protein
LLVAGEAPVPDERVKHNVKWLDVVRTVRLVITGFVLTWALVCLMQMAEHKLQHDLFARPTAPYVSVDGHLEHSPSVEIRLSEWIRAMFRDVVFFWMVGN